MNGGWRNKYHLKKDAKACCHFHCRTHRALFNRQNCNHPVPRARRNRLVTHIPPLGEVLASGQSTAPIANRQIFKQIHSQVLSYRLGKLSPVWTQRQTHPSTYPINRIRNMENRVKRECWIGSRSYNMASRFVMLQSETLFKPMQSYSN